MNTQWRKIAADFRAHRLQIFLVALILLLGTAGVIAALNARAVLAREIDASYRRANGADIILWFDKIDPPLLELVRSRPGVAEAEARSNAFMRVGARNGEWFPARITVLPDFAKQKVNVIHRDDAVAMQNSDGVLVEQSGASLLGVREGESLQFRTPAGETMAVPLSAWVHDPAVAPSTQDRMIYAYVTPAVAASLGEKAELDQLFVTLKTRGDLSDTSAFADELSAWLKKQNAAPLRVDALSNKHPHAMLMTAMLRVLEVLAGIAFICSATLAACVISLWMRREVRQVGIMKTLGARSWQLARQYLALVAPVVLLSVALALPLGIAVARSVVRYHQTLLNIDVTDWSVPRSLLFSELIVAVAVPFLAMALPIIRAARLSPRRAIQDPGIVAPRGPIALTSRLIRMPGNRRLTFALRNSFRRPWRLALTLLALSAGGALLLTAHNNYESLMRVVDTALAHRGYDLEAQFQRPAPAAQLEAAARTVPDVEIAEAYRRAGVNLVAEDDGAVAVREGRRMLLTGYPAETRLLTLPLYDGRWPLESDQNGVVINRHVQQVRPELRAGGEVTIKFRDRKTKVRIVGVVEEIGGPVIYAPFPTFERITALGDVSHLVRVKAAPGRQQLVAGTLEKAFLDAKVIPSMISTKSEFRASLDEHFAVVGAVMKMIALASALVGAITLVATVSLGVIERAREIGVIRALGARPRSVTGLFLVEGGAVALLSAALSVAGGIYFARVLGSMAERQLLHVAVPLYLSRTGMAIFSCGAVLIVGAVWLSVRRLLRVSVREVLAYE